MLTYYAFARSAGEVWLGQAVVVVAILHVSCLFHGWSVWILCCLLTGFIPFWGQKTQTRRREKENKSYTEITQSVAFTSISTVSWCNNSTLLRLSLFIFAPAILLDHHFTWAVVGLLCSRICESAFMRSAACVCVCVFYKLALEPSGLIMWPGNYTGLSEKARAAWHQNGSGLGLSEEKRCV